MANGNLSLFLFQRVQQLLQLISLRGSLLAFDVIALRQEAQMF